MADKEPKWHYEKLNEKGQREWAPANDADGKITGRHVFGLKFWLDENPEERIRLGYIKHIEHDTKDIEYDHATQYLVNTVKRVDEDSLVTRMAVVWPKGRDLSPLAERFVSMFEAAYAPEAADDGAADDGAAGRAAES